MNDLKNSNYFLLRFVRFFLFRVDLFFLRLCFVLRFLRLFLRLVFLPPFWRGVVGDIDCKNLLKTPAAPVWTLDNT
jgi:hypothetical protein